MPNSRIEAATFLSDDALELLGAWTTDGNNLLGGGGDLIGSTDNFGFFFLTNSIRRGGFLNSGEFFLATNGSNPDQRAVFKPLRFTTDDETDQVKFSFTIPDNTVYNFNVGVQFRNANGTSWGRLQRSFTVNREGVLISNTDLTYPETERFNANGTKTQWIVNGNDVELVVNGLIAEDLIWTGLVRYQGARNF